jgi:hypothetical protein
MSNREEFVAALRELATFYEEHPAIPLPEQYKGVHLTAQVSTVAELREAFHLSGPWKKEYISEYAFYHKPFGPQPPPGKYELPSEVYSPSWTKGNHVNLTISLPREEVCVKRKTGERWIPAYTPLINMPTEGHYESTYEWDCM